MTAARKRFSLVDILLTISLFQLTHVGCSENTYDDSIIDTGFYSDYFPVPEPSLNTAVPPVSPILEPALSSPPVSEPSVDHPDEERPALSPPSAQSSSPPGTLIASPPLELLCPPSYDGHADPPETEDSPRMAPAPERDDPVRDDSKELGTNRIKVFFIVIFPSLSESTFDEAKVVAAVQQVTRDLGARSDFEIKIHSVLNLLGARRKLKSSRSQIMSTVRGIKLKAEASFLGADEAAANEFVELLSESPSSIFPSSEFGQVDVSEFEVVRESEASILLPICFGVLGGLMFCSAIALIIVRRKKKALVKKPSGIAPGTQRYQNEGNLPWVEGHSHSYSTRNLLESISSKDYSSPHDETYKCGIVVNNLGAGLM